MRGVTVITCTIRSNQRENILRNYSHQRFENKELIIILNQSDMDLDEWRQAVAGLGEISVYKKTNMSPGACLNFGIKKSKYPFIAKFDDDDYYAPNYLTQAIDTLEKTDASVVGKMSNLTYFEGSKLLAVRRPRNENKYLEQIDFHEQHLGGGTLVWKRELFPSIKFPNIGIQEDVYFQKKCLEKNYKLYSTDQYHYVSIRREDTKSHTCKTEDHVLLKDCDILNFTGNLKSIAQGRERVDSLNGVTIVTCTKRANNIDNIFENYVRQKWDDKELIVILNDDEMKLEQWQKKANQYQDVKVFQLPSEETLGQCLNFAVTQSKYDIIAKFDDDDYYSPYYVPQAMKEFEDEEADIVGKAVIYTYFTNLKQLGLRNSRIPICGATLMFTKTVFKEVQFPLVNNGEDGRFLIDAIQNHFKICSTTPYNYVNIRYDTSEHTWQVPDKRLLRYSYNIVETNHFIPFITKDPSA